MSEILSNGSESRAIFIPGPSTHTGSFSSFAKSSSMVSFFRSVCKVAEENLKLSSYQIRIFPSRILGSSASKSIEEPGGRIREIAYAAGFWLVCTSENLSRNDGPAEFLGKKLQDNISFEDKDGQIVKLSLTYKDCVVAESKYTRTFLDIKGRHMYYTSPLSSSKTLLELKDDEIKDLFSSVVDLVDAPQDKKPNAESNIDKEVKVMDQAVEKSHFEEICVDTRIFNNRLHVKVFEPSKNFLERWEKHKAYQEIKSICPNEKETEGESVTTNLPGEIKTSDLKSGQRDMSDAKPEDKKNSNRGRGGRRSHGVRRLPDRQSGTCKWFNTVKGYGFILPEEGKDDIFVHQTAIKAVGFRSLAEGERVEFDVEVDSTGRKKARNVTGPNGSYVRGAPFVHPYGGVRRGGYIHRGYARGGWGRGGSADDMGVYTSTGFSRFRGRGGARGGGRTDFGGSGNGQVDGFQGRYSYPSAYPYTDYSGTGYPVYGGYPGGQQNMYIPPQTMQQGRGGTNMLSNQMQGLSLQQMGMRGGMGQVSQMGSPQQVYGFPQAMMPTSSTNEGVQGSSGRGRGGTGRGRGSHSNSSNKKTPNGKEP